MKRLSRRFIVIALCALMTLVFASCTQPDNNPAGQQPEEEKPFISNSFFYGDWEVWSENPVTHEQQKEQYLSVKISEDDFQMLNGETVIISLAQLAEDPYATWIDGVDFFGYQVKADNGDGTYSYTAYSVTVDTEDTLIYKQRQSSEYSSWNERDPKVTTYTLKRVGETPDYE